MIKFFCDKCGGECNEAGSGTRRFEELAASGSGKPLGFEITPTNDGVISQHNHLCNECVPELLIIAAKTFKRAAVITKQSELGSDAERFSALKETLHNQTLAASKKEKAAEEKIAAAELSIAQAQQQSKIDGETIAILHAQVSTLKMKFLSLEQRKAAAAIQDKIDRKESPEYIARVEKRERLRALP